MDLAEFTYSLTGDFPSEEKFGLTCQMRRAAISIPSNIAEGAGRKTNGEFKQFMGVAIGSLFELETQLQLAVRFDYIQKANQELEIIQSLRKMLFGLQKSLK